MPLYRRPADTGCRDAGFEDHWLTFAGAMHVEIFDEAAGRRISAAVEEERQGLIRDAERENGGDGERNRHMTKLLRHGISVAPHCLERTAPRIVLAKSESGR